MNTATKATTATLITTLLLFLLTPTPATAPETQPTLTQGEISIIVTDKIPTIWVEDVNIGNMTLKTYADGQRVTPSWTVTQHPDNITWTSSAAGHNSSLWFKKNTNMDSIKFGSHAEFTTKRDVDAEFSWTRNPDANYTVNNKHVTVTHPDLSQPYTIDYTDMFNIQNRDSLTLTRDKALINYTDVDEILIDPALSSEPWRALTKIELTDTGARYYTVAAKIVDTENVNGDQTPWNHTPGIQIQLNFSWVTTGVPLFGQADTAEIETRLPGKPNIIGNQWTVNVNNDANGWETRTLHFDNDPLNQTLEDNRTGMLEVYVNLVNTGIGEWDEYDSRGDSTNPTVGVTHNWARGYWRSNALIENSSVSNVAVNGAEPALFAFPDTTFNEINVTAQYYDSISANMRHEQDTGNIRNEPSLGGFTDKNLTLIFDQAATGTTNEGRINDDYATQPVDLTYKITNIQGSFGGDQQYVWNQTGHPTGWTRIDDDEITFNNRFNVNATINISSDGSTRNENIDTNATIYNRGHPVNYQFFVLNGRDEQVSITGTVQVLADDDTVEDSQSVSGATYNDTYTVASTDKAAHDTTGSPKHFFIDYGDNDATSNDAHNVSSFYMLNNRPQRTSTLADINSSTTFPTPNDQGEITWIEGFQTVFNWNEVRNVRNEPVTSVTTDFQIRDSTDTLITSTSRTTGNDGWTTSSVDTKTQTPSGVWTFNGSITHNGNSGTQTSNVEFVEGGDDPITLQCSQVIAENQNISCSLQLTIINGTAITGQTPTLNWTAPTGATDTLTMTERADGVYHGSFIANETGEWFVLANNTFQGENHFAGQAINVQTSFAGGGGGGGLTTDQNATLYDTNEKTTDIRDNVFDGRQIKNLNCAPVHTSIQITPINCSFTLQYTNGTFRNDIGLRYRISNATIGLVQSGTTNNIGVRGAYSLTFTPPTLGHFFIEVFNNTEQISSITNIHVDNDTFTLTESLNNTLLTHNTTTHNKLDDITTNINNIPTDVWGFSDRQLTDFTFTVDTNNTLIATFVWNHTTRTLTQPVEATLSTSERRNIAIETLKTFIATRYATRTAMINGGVLER